MVWKLRVSCRALKRSCSFVLKRSQALPAVSIARRKLLHSVSSLVLSVFAAIVAASVLNGYSRLRCSGVLACT